jgi:tight adherence protein B
VSGLGILACLAAVGLAAAALGLPAPWRGLQVRAAARRRGRAVDEGLPDALRALAAELGAGRTLERALVSTAERTSGPLGSALAGAAGAHARGDRLDEALAQALPSSEAVRLLAAGVGLQRRLGGDLPRLCRELAHTLEERARVEADVRSMTAQARWSAMVVPLLPPLGLVAMLAVDPVGVRLLFSTPPGLALVAVALVLDAAGAVIIRRLAVTIG